MKAAKLNQRISQGADFNFPFQIQQPLGTNLSLAGATLRGSARKNVADAAAAFDFVGTVVDALTGQGKFTLAGSVTSALTLDTSEDCLKALTCYNYDFEIEFSDGTIFRIIEGKALVSPEATK